MNVSACSSSPSAMHRMIPILENVAIARDTFRLRLGDAEMARALRAGQFVMIRPGPEGATDPLLGRALALYDVAYDAIGTPSAFDVVYLVIGRGTTALSLRRPGERLAVLGPLGNGFGPPPTGPVVFVAGGIGQTPFLALGRSWLQAAGPYRGDFAPVTAKKGPAPDTAVQKQNGGIERETDAVAGPGPCTAPVTLLYGVRTAALLAGVDDFRRAGIAVELATDDGTAGHHGFVTELLARRLARGERPAKVVGCGPPAMLATLAKLVAAHRIACDVSLESQMACGFGACFSCVAPIRQDDGSFDLRRVCVEGPVVPADRVDWLHMVH
jgi:dihydroorotate dehydrogenase electron transfer subunit